MKLALSNCNGNIWLFINHDIFTYVLRDTVQKLNVQLHDQNKALNFVVTVVYAKCSTNKRLTLWDDIYQVAATMPTPWLIGGDFNFVLKSKEKIGGLPVFDVEDFETYISSCDLTEIPFKGSPISLVEW